MVGKLGNKGITAGILTIIIAVVVAVLSIAIAIGVYHIGYSSVGAMGTVTGSATIIGTNGLSITLTASGGHVIVQGLIIYDPNGNVLYTLGNVGSTSSSSSSSSTSCTPTIYVPSSSSPLNSWPTNGITIQAGQSATINLGGSSCNLGTAATVQVIYNNGKSTTITVGS